MSRERIGFQKRPGLSGEIQEILATEFPGLYLHLRTIWKKIPLRPYIAQKNIGDIVFKMMVANRQEQTIVAGVCFEKESLGKMLSVIGPETTFVDVGAATGTWTIPAAIKIGPQGGVYSFEPDHECNQALKGNLALNSLTNVTVIELALWEKDTTLILHTSGRKGEAPQVTEGKDLLSGEKFRHHFNVQAKSMTALVEEGTIKAPNVVKIDVEGAGLQVLQGMGDLRPREIFIEIHPKLGEERDEIMGLLETRGYQLTSEAPRGGEIHFHFSLP